jgi:membrane protease YdiL (CAAX protease family)
MSFRLWRDDAFVLAYFLLPLVLNLLFLSESWTQTKSNWQDWVLSEVGLLSILAAPIAEEYFFRGWLLKRQWEALESLPRKSFWTAFKTCYVNALVFWLMHMPIDLNLWKQALLVGAVPASPGPFLLGLVTCLLTLRTGNLRAAILFHAVANASGPLWWPLMASENLRSIFYN